MTTPAAQSLSGKVRGADEGPGPSGSCTLTPFCSTRQFTVTSPAAPAAIPVLSWAVTRALEEKHWSREDIVAVQLAFQEAVANAIRHGCGGDARKRFRCSVRCDEDEVVVVVRDPGPGFDPGVIADPRDPDNLLRPSGRGLFLIERLMDRVQFADGGREIEMRKKRLRLPAAHQAVAT
jgi:serine/threonine-protein kinase RsbW